MMIMSAELAHELRKHYDEYANGESSPLPFMVWLYDKIYAKLHTPECISYMKQDKSGRFSHMFPKEET